MSYSIKEIEDKLKAKLDPANVKSREQGGAKVQYIEGWHAIQTMNDIFGHANWDRETVHIKQVCQYENKNSNHVIGYEAKVRVIVTIEGNEFVREGTGFGSGIAKDLFSAIESAGKEAETDAMKRALMTLGNPLGLALYDKKRENVGIEEPQINPAFANDVERQNFKEAMIEIYQGAKNAEELKKFGAANKAKTDLMKVGTNEDIEAFNDILAAYTKCQRALKPKEKTVDPLVHGLQH